MIDENIGNSKWSDCTKTTENPKGFNPAVLAILRDCEGDVRTGKGTCPICSGRSLSLDNGKKHLVAIKCWKCGNEGASEIIDHYRDKGLWPTSSKLTDEFTSFKAEEARSPEERRKYAASVWQKLKNSRGLEFAKFCLKDYLLGRGIKKVPYNAMIALPDVIMFGSSNGGLNFPHITMVLPIRDTNRRLWGILLTRLSDDGRTKADIPKEEQRRSHGVVKGNFIPLSEGVWEEPHTLLIGEGVETVLSAMQLTGKPGIASAGASFFRYIQPPRCQRYIILADNGLVGQNAAFELAERLAEEYPDCEVLVATPGNSTASGYDWNDALVDAGEDQNKLADLRDEILKAPLYDQARWDEPDLSLTDERRGELPKLPIELFDELNCPQLTEWLERAGQGAGTSVDHVFLFLLGIASGLIGCARRIQATRSWAQCTTCWVALIGYSGEGKTPSLAAVKNSLDELEADRRYEIDRLRREHEAKVEVAKAACAKWKKEIAKQHHSKFFIAEKPEEADDPGRFVEPRLYVTDSTTEKIAPLLNARPQGIMLILDELSGLFANMGRYNRGDDRSFYLEAWDGKRRLIERIDRGSIEVKNHLIGLVGGLQPDKLAVIFKGDDDGMYTRFLFAWPEEPPYQPLTDDLEETDRELTKALDKLSRLDVVNKRIPLSEQARKRFTRLHKEVHDNRGALYGRELEWWSKVPNHVLRIASTLAFLRWAIVGGKEPQDIKYQYVNVAARLVVEYFWPHARAALNQTAERHANERRILRWIRANKLEDVGSEDIRRHAMAQRLDAEQTRGVLSTLVRKGWLRMVNTNPRTAKGGRPKLRWVVNPKLASDLGSGGEE